MQKPKWHGAGDPLAVALGALADAAADSREAAAGRAYAALSRMVEEEGGAWGPEDWKVVVTWAACDMFAPVEYEKYLVSWRARG